MRPRRCRGALAGLALLAALAGCTASTSGHRSQTSAAASTASTRSTAATSGSAATSPGSTVGPAGSAGSAPRLASLTCAAPEVTATGAPFCYTRPTGFYDYSSMSDYATGWTYRTLLGLGGHDEIEVLAQPVGADLDALTTAQAAQYAQRYRLVAGQAGVRSATGLSPPTVASARAFHQRVVYTSKVVGLSVLVLRGHRLVYLSCQYVAHDARQSRLLAGCSSALRTLQIAYT